MYYELYVDVFFLINFTMDTILLALLKKALACPVRYGRIIAGGVLGAVLTCVVVIWPCKTTWAKFIVFHGVINVLMLRTGLGLKWGRELFRGWVILYIESFLLGGVLQFAGQYLRQGSVFFALAVISYYVVLGIWKIILLFSEKGNRYCEVVVFFGERNCRLRALIDTGNTLKDTVSKDPVSVMDQASVKRLTEGKQPERFRYIPYHSIGKKEGVMPAFRMDKIQIIRDGYRINVEHPLVAVCEEELGSENYQMIINPDILAGGKKNGDKSSSSCLLYTSDADILPAPLEAAAEKKAIKDLGTEKDENARKILIEHNLRLVVYIAKKFDNTGVGVEDLISIGTIGLIKAINTFNPDKNIKLATYASRCIENEILMYLRRNNKTRMEVSIDEPLNVDWDGNELLLSDILGTEEDAIYKDLENEAEKKVLIRAIGRLSGREQMIIRMRFGLGTEDGEEKTQKEVADMLGISQSYISRLEKKIMQRLRREMVKYS